MDAVAEGHLMPASERMDHFGKLLSEGVSPGVPFLINADFGHQTLVKWEDA